MPVNPDTENPCDISVITHQTPAPCVECLSLSEKQALKVYLLAQELNLAGGTDYTNIATLRQAAACFDCGLSDSRLLTLEIQTIVQALENQDWTGSVTEEAAKHAISCLRCIPRHTLKAMELIIWCGLQNLLSQPVIL